MMYEIVCSEVVEWAENYDGPKFHAMLCDPPYEIKFMNKAWDGKGVSFDPKTWKALSEHLYPGAFIMVFGGSRTYHRMAVAIEDAGFVMHSAFVWVNGQGFPKSTKVKGSEGFAGHRYGRQAIKPAAEFICLAQKPYEGRPVDCIVENGAGALNIDGGRIGSEQVQLNNYDSHGPEGSLAYRNGTHAGEEYHVRKSQGRWPANFLLSHTPLCEKVGTRKVRGDGHWTHKREIGDGNIYGTGGYEDLDQGNLLANEEIPDWSCVPECPVRKLNEQAGQRQSGKMKAGTRRANRNGYTGPMPSQTGQATIGDKGSCSRFFHQSDYSYEVAEQIAQADVAYYCAKTGKKERNLGLGNLSLKTGGGMQGTADQTLLTGSGNVRNNKMRNPHPTVKPLKLLKYLATLLLPPSSYAPRRILIPFAGVMSEGIGAILTGWEEVIGIEISQDYCNIGDARAKYWSSLPWQEKLL